MGQVATSGPAGDAPTNAAPAASRHHSRLRRSGRGLLEAVGQVGEPQVWQVACAVASAASGNLCPLDGLGLCDDLAEPRVGRGVPVPPGDVAADHAGLLGVAVVVGAVQSEVAQRGELGLEMRFNHEP